MLKFYTIKHLSRAAEGSGPMNPGNLLLMKQGAKSSKMGANLGDKVKYVTSSVFPKWKVFLLSRKAEPWAEAR
jgi:hypothetical protein